MRKKKFTSYYSSRKLPLIRVMWRTKEREPLSGIEPNNGGKGFGMWSVFPPAHRPPYPILLRIGFNWERPLKKSDKDSTNEPEEIPEDKWEEQQVVLRTLLLLLGAIGSANDAEDHGYKGDADLMRSDSRQAMRELIDEHTFLCKIFPDLRQELESQKFLGYGWLWVCRDIEACLSAFTGEQRIS